jgi:hypothetical protein
LLFEQSAEVRGGGAMTTLIGAGIGCLRFHHAPLALEKQAEVESASAVAEVIGATVRRLGLGQRPLLFEQSAEVRGGGAMTTLIGATIGCLRVIHAPLAREKRAEMESASGLVCPGEIVRLSPRQRAVRAITIPIRTGFGAMPVGVNVVPVGSGDGFVIAVRRCEDWLVERRQCRIGGGPLRDGGPAVAARGRAPARSDEQPSNEHQCQHERQAAHAKSRGVYGLGDLKLMAASSGAGQTIVITSSGKNIHLDGGTRLLLVVPEQVAVAPSK